jgi:hypothetical protein
VLGWMAIGYPPRRSPGLELAGITRADVNIVGADSLWSSSLTDGPRRAMAVNRRERPCRGRVDGRRHHALLEPPLSARRGQRSRRCVADSASSTGRRRRS